MEFKRLLDIRLPRGKSAFLWGPRKTGKSFYLRQRFPKSVVYDFLDTDLFFELSKRPALLREQILALPEPKLCQPIILDEIQKIPTLLDEVQWLMENKHLSFILCGSSARKLIRGHANLLGGRAWRYELFPMVTAETMPGNGSDLLRILNHGMIPSHFLDSPDTYRQSLKAYIQDYLSQEVFAEGLARNMPAFSRFFDAVGYGHGELVNFANVARECGVDAKTAKEYYQILVDTLLGAFVEPYKKKQSRDVIIKAPKFYLFDVGVAGALCKRVVEESRGEGFGRAFEQFIMLEIRAYRSYSQKDFEIHFWRTKDGLETDFILGDAEVAVEVKGSSQIHSRDIHGIKVFSQTNKPRASFVVSNESKQRIAENNIRVLPWKIFLDELWSGKIIK